MEYHWSILKRFEGTVMKVNKNLLMSVLKKYGQTQKELASLLGLSLSRTNAKINEKQGAQFTQIEIMTIKERYGLSAQEVDSIFFDRKVS